MKSCREKLEHRIDSLEANLAYLDKQYPGGKALAQELSSCAQELMEDASVDDQVFLRARIDQLKAKYGLPDV